MYNPIISKEEISLSPRAVLEMADIIRSADDVNIIRIFVSGGGCGGMTYGMTFTDYPNSTDKSRKFEGFELVVDIIAIQYLNGCDIDFVSSGLNNSFVFNNVFQAIGGAGTCGTCGAAAGAGCAA